MRTATLRRTCSACISAIASAAMLTVSVQTAPAFVDPAEAQAQTSPTGPKAEPLFTQATRTAGVPPSDMDAHALRRAAINVSEKALASGIVLTAEAHILNLFPDVQILAMRSRVESRSRTSYSWFGYIPGDDFGRVIITVANGKLGAAVTHNGRRYLILPSPDGRHDVYEVDERSFQEGDDVDPAVLLDDVGIPPKTGGAPASPVLEASPLDSGGLVKIVGWDLVASNGGDLKMMMKPDDGSVIDVMVVYTHEAAKYTDLSHYASSSLWHPVPYNMLIRIQLGIDIANQSFIDSGVSIYLNVVGDPFEDPTYQEDGVALTDLTAVKTGQFAGVREERDERAADLVMLVAARADDQAGDPLCGRSFWTRPWTVSNETAAARNGYFLVKASCLIGFTPAHEIGHQLGANHDWYTLGLTGGAGSEAPHAHGYTWMSAGKTAGFYTIMAYDWHCRDEFPGYAQNPSNCTRLGRWSDPNETHPVFGVPLGVFEPAVDSAHDAKTVTNNRKPVANYRLSACRATTGC